MMVFALGIATSPSASLAQDIIYVDTNANGNDNGFTWGDAYPNLQDALADPNLEANDEIWVAEGIYYPDEGSGQTNDDRSATFQLVDDVAIYGGFDPDSGDDEFAERDWVANPTILSGDIDHETNPDTNVNGVVTDADDIAGSNAYHVVSNLGR